MSHHGLSYTRNSVNYKFPKHFSLAIFQVIVLQVSHSNCVTAHLRLYVPSLLEMQKRFAKPNFKVEVIAGGSLSPAQFFSFF